MPFISRFADDPTRPGIRSALRDAVLRAVLPGVAVFGVVVAVGLVLKGPLSGFATSEEAVNRSLVAWRKPAWDSITMLFSHIGNTEYVIGVCVLVSAVICWRTRQWWYAAVPLLAISLQATIFVLTTLLIARPRPDVSHVDPAPPTSSYPSGHQGASTGALRHLRPDGDPHPSAGAAHDRPSAVRARPFPRGLRPALPGHAPRERRDDGGGQRLHLRDARLGLPASRPGGRAR